MEGNSRCGLVSPDQTAWANSCRADVADCVGPRSSIFNASKAGIDVAIVGPKPVAIGSTQQTSGCKGRASFQHIVLAIKKWRRVAGIERKRAKARQRRERAPGPLPTVAHQLGHP